MLNGLSLFSGIGGLELGLADWVRPVAYCEIDPFAQAVLLNRMADGMLPRAPIWTDIRTLPVREMPTIDIVFGGFPCTDISSASRGRGAGITGPSSGLWTEMLRIVSEVRPGEVFIENVAGAAAGRWLPELRLALYRVGYTSVPFQVCASEVGAPFPGTRIFLAATDCHSESVSGVHAQVAVMPKPTGDAGQDWGKPTSRAMGVADGIPCRVDRLRATGNAVVPAQAREAYRRWKKIV